MQSKLSHMQQLQQKTEMELLDARMFSASLENELDDEDGSGTVSYSVSLLNNNNNNNTRSSIACLTYMSRHALQKGIG